MNIEDFAALKQSIYPQKKKKTGVTHLFFTKALSFLRTNLISTLRSKRPASKPSRLFSFRQQNRPYKT